MFKLKGNNMKKVLLSVFLGLLIAPNANAVPSCGSSLMPAFTANQATQLCKTFGSAVSQSLIPSTDNTYDVGSSSLGWRTGYFDTSVITPLVSHATSLALGIAGTAEATFTDNALTLSGASFSVVPGATSLLFKNNANSATNLSIVDAGTLAIRADIVPATVSTSILGSAALPMFQVIQGAIALDADVTSVTGAAGMQNSRNTASADNFGLVGYGANANGVTIQAFKTRAATTDANTIVQSGDAILTLAGRGADGASYRSAAQIIMTVDGTPGSSDMPGAIDFLVSPDGSATPASALKISNTKNIVFGGTLIGTGTATIGWTVQAAANQACSTTCVTPCVTGIDTLGTGGFLDCATATADFCLCAGAS